jgi:hypothetical protein
MMESHSSFSNTDLLDLGFILLDCMEGRPIPAERRHCNLVRQRRKENKVFGLRNAERWSGSKQLIDFLDDIFGEDRPIQTKFNKPVSSNLKNDHFEIFVSITYQHRFISPKPDHQDCLRQYVELVALECFAQFDAAQ